MVNSSAILSFRMFADDANIFYANKVPKEIELVMNIELKKSYWLLYYKQIICQYEEN